MSANLLHSERLSHQGRQSLLLLFLVQVGEHDESRVGSSFEQHQYVETGQARRLSPLSSNKERSKRALQGQTPPFYNQRSVLRFPLWYRGHSRIASNNKLQKVKECRLILEVTRCHHRVLSRESDEERSHPGPDLLCDLARIFIENERLQKMMRSQEKVLGHAGRP